MKETYSDFIDLLIDALEEADEEETTKGGEGSGNFGHHGLAGVWGGSSPTKGSGGSNSLGADSPKSDQKLTVFGAGSDYEFEGDKYIQWDYSRGEYEKMPVISYNPKPFKKTGSMGGWYIVTQMGMKNFSGETRNERVTLDFHYKKDAEKLIDYFSSLGLSEYQGD